MNIIINAANSLEVVHQDIRQQLKADQVLLSVSVLPDDSLRVDTLAHSAQNIREIGAALKDIGAELMAVTDEQWNDDPAL